MEGGRYSQTLEVGNDRAELTRVSGWLHAAARIMKLPATVLSELDVCAEEAVHNVIAHAYEDSLPHRIQLRLDRTSGQVRLEIEDDGRPFNPLEHPPLKPATTLDEAPLGGYGIHLMRSLMTECSYRRENGKNILTLARSCEAG
jgi:serine/threonine-protein kinase RsbW